MMELTKTDYFLGALEMWGAVLCIMAALFVFFSRKTNPKGVKEMIIMQLICAVMMFSDVTACFAIGTTEPSAYYSVRVGYFLCFGLAYACLFLFGKYFERFIECDSTNKLGLIFVEIFALVGVILTIINLWVPFYYYFDQGNN